MPALLPDLLGATARKLPDATARASGSKRWSYAELETLADRLAAVLPFFHLFGQTMTLNAPLSVGAHVFPMERFNPARLLDRLQQDQITVLCGVPGIFAALLAAAGRRAPIEHALRGRDFRRVPTAARPGAPLGGSLRAIPAPGLWLDGGGASLPVQSGDPFPEVEVSIRDPMQLGMAEEHPGAG